MDDIKKYQRIFELYKRVQDRRFQCVISRPRGINGISVADDFWAIQYQSIAMRYEILRAYLERRPINWGWADYLSREVQERRNLISRAKFNKKYGE